MHRQTVFFCLFLGLLALPHSSSAQIQTPLDIALRYLESHASEWGLAQADIASLTVSDQYTSSHNGITHIYLQQQHAGIPIRNAILGIHVRPDGQVAYAVNRFLEKIADRINTTRPTVSSGRAMEAVAGHLGLSLAKAPTRLEQSDNRVVRYSGGSLSRSPIPAQLVYQPMPNGSLRLAWDLGIHDPRNTDYWGIRLDALTGRVLAQDNHTISCNFGVSEASHSDDCAQAHTEAQPLARALEAAHAPLVDQAAYTVFPVPVESPIHGQQKMVANPANSSASPYGWHDTNGQPGPEFTITRGNNVHAFLDKNDDDASDGGEPNGGPELIFDFPYSPFLEPMDQPDAAVTQLFYMNNFMHDLAYRYGFDEAAGNFQANNYGKGGKQLDAVLAQAQDGGGTNNANFLTLADGNPGAMQMYFWTPGNAEYLRLDAPASISGILRVGTASFGPMITTKGISGQVVVARDSAGTELACSRILNDSEIRGNIALITRGTCTFKQKVLAAEAAGAIGVIIANVENLTLNMSGTTDPPHPTIPVVLIRSSDAQLIKNAIAQGQAARATIKYYGQGPALRDASFDNGIVAHEYGHGISNRLTGGPNRPDCLFNDEAMGEGWSDFFTLVTSVQPGQNGKLPRGIGNYANRNEPDGAGIRRKPYSTDFSVNNQVYNDIIGTRVSTTTRNPHAVGEIWAAALWDLYWALSDKYGWDPDPINGKGGNNMAIQLVMDGMKLQPCNPGFIDGRDAILQADMLNNGGANQCLIWEVFARRGLGFSADQGDTNDRNDGLQAFNVRPQCIQSLKMLKRATPLIKPGEPITVIIQLTNHKSETLTGLMVRDQIPANATFVPGSVQGAGTAKLENGELLIDAGDLAPGEVRNIFYQLNTPQGLFSRRLFLDDLEAGPANWDTTMIQGTSGWTLASTGANSGSRVWKIASPTRANHHALELTTPLKITGKQPMLRFFHRYNTQKTYDGGIVEVSVNGGLTWTTLAQERIFRNTYSRPLVNTVFGNATTKGFSGAGTSYFDASYADLSAYIGQEIRVRFRFATNDDPSGSTLQTMEGWLIDDIELFDAFNYMSEACASSAQGDNICIMTESKGTIVEPAVATSTDDPLARSYVSVFPNPASDWLTVQVQQEASGLFVAELLSPEGRLIRQQQLTAPAGESQLSLSVKDLPAGLYFLRMRLNGEQKVERIAIAR